MSQSQSEEGDEESDISDALRDISIPPEAEMGEWHLEDGPRPLTHHQRALAESALRHGNEKDVRTFFPFPVFAFLVLL